MKRITLVLAFSVLTSVAASAKSVAPRMPVSPAASLGEIRLGMTRKQVAALHLATKPSTNPHTQTVGPYEVVYGADDTVNFVSIELRHAPRGLVVGDKAIISDATTAEAAAAFADCGKMEIRTGGNVVTCENGGAMVLESVPDEAGGAHIVRVAVQRPKQ